jgi:hypothetical protein
MALSSYDFAKSAQGQALQFNDPALQAMTYGSAAEARAGLKRDFNMNDKDIESSIAAVKANGGFGKTRQVWAAKQLAATGTGYNDAEQMFATINRASGGNLDLAQSMWGEMRGTSERAGRGEMKSSYGMGAALLEKMHNDGVAHAGTAAISSRYADDFTEMGVDAARGFDNVSLMRQKPQAIRNHMRSLERAQQMYQRRLETPPTPPPPGKDPYKHAAEQVRQREEAATKLGQIRAKMENMQDYSSYGSETVAENIHGKRNVVIAEHGADGYPAVAITTRDAGTERSLPHVINAQEAAASEAREDWQGPAPARSAFIEERQARMSPEERRRLGIDTPSGDDEG